MDEEKVKSAVFAGAIVFALIVVSLILYFEDTVSKAFFWVVIGVLIIYVLFRFKIVLQLRDFQRAVIFRFGKLNRVGGPGWTFVLPLIERPNIVNLRTQVSDIPPQNVLTKDNIQLTIDAIIYMYVKSDRESVVNSVVKVEDYKQAATTFVIAKIRDVIGGINFTDVVSNIEDINKDIKKELESIAKEWGVGIQAVEIRDIKVPDSIVEEMHNQKAAVQRKLAAYEDAEASKAKILAVKEATEQLSERTVIYYYIKALEKMAEGKSSKIIFPLEVTEILKKISGNISPNPQVIAKEAPKELEKDLEKGLNSGTLNKYLPLIKKYLDNAKKS